MDADYDRRSRERGHERGKWPCDRREASVRRKVRVGSDDEHEQGRVNEKWPLGTWECYLGIQIGLRRLFV